MIDQSINAKIEEFSLAGINEENTAVIIPSVSMTSSRSGIHTYYFFNLGTKRGFSVKISHREIIFPGLSKLEKVNIRQYPFLSKLSFLFQKYHYGFNFLEQILLMTVPHTITPLGESKFLINLWAYCGAILVDCRSKRVVYRMLDSGDEGQVLGAKQWYDSPSSTLYYMTYSLGDSLKKAVNPFEKVQSWIVKQNLETGETTELWTGIFSDYMHDIVISRDKKYLVVCELGRFTDKNKNLIPSKVLVLNLVNGKQWIINNIANAAHAQFDPDNPDIVYFSNHNFQFVHTQILDLLRKGTYTLNFFGPAAVYKYRLTDDGPQERGVFSEPDLFRLTNFHVFFNRDRKIIAAMGAPNFIYLADAVNMSLIRKIEVTNPDTPAYIGTFYPSTDGEKLYVQTTRSFQVIDIESGQSEFFRKYDYNHTCSNHMLLSSDTNW